MLLLKTVAKSPPMLSTPPGRVFNDLGDTGGVVGFGGETVLFIKLALIEHPGHSTPATSSYPKIASKQGTRLLPCETLLTPMLDRVGVTGKGMDNVVKGVY